MNNLIFFLLIFGTVLAIIGTNLNEKRNENKNQIDDKREKVMWRCWYSAFMLYYFIIPTAIIQFQSERTLGNKLIDSLYLFLHLDSWGIIYLIGSFLAFLVGVVTWTIFLIFSKWSDQINLRLIDSINSSISSIDYYIDLKNQQALKIDLSEAYKLKLPSYLMRSQIDYQDSKKFLSWLPFWLFLSWLSVIFQIGVIFSLINEKINNDQKSVEQIQFEALCNNLLSDEQKKDLLLKFIIVPDEHKSIF